MTAPGEEWILLSDALALVSPNWRTGFGLLGGGDRERILRWLADERLTARADEVVEYVVVEPQRPEQPAAPRQLDDAASADALAEAIKGEATYRTVFTGHMTPRSEWPLNRLERCHIHMPPEIFSYHDLRLHRMWDENELTISMTDGTEARSIFYDIRVEKNLLLERAGLRRSAEQPKYEPAVSDTSQNIATDLRKGRRLGMAQWDQWVAQYKRDRPVLPDVDRKIYREARETFGDSVTQAMCREAFGGNKPGPR